MKENKKQNYILYSTNIKYDNDIQNNINKDDFAFWYREGVKNKKQALQAQELLKQEGIKADYSKGPFYIDFKGAGVEQRVTHQLLRNAGLTNFVIIHHILKEDDDTTYALYITTVEYDNGENGYMYKLVDLDTGEEVGSKIGFKPLYFIGNGDVNDRQALLGKDFNDIKTHGMYQDEVVDKEEALYIYNGLLTGDDFYGDKLSFDPRELAPLN